MFNIYKYEIRNVFKLISNIAFVCTEYCNGIISYVQVKYISKTDIWVTTLNNIDNEIENGDHFMLKNEYCTFNYNK